MFLHTILFELIPEEKNQNIFLILQSSCAPFASGLIKITKRESQTERLFFRETFSHSLWLDWRFPPIFLKMLTVHYLMIEFSHFQFSSHAYCAKIHETQIMTTAEEYDYFSWVRHFNDESKQSKNIFEENAKENTISSEVADTSAEWNWTQLSENCRYLYRLLNNSFLHEWNFFEQ